MATAAKLLAGQCSLTAITHSHNSHANMCLYVCGHFQMKLKSVLFRIWMNFWFSIFLPILALIVREGCAAAASTNSQFINVKCVCVYVSACLPLWERLCVCVCMWVSANWFCYSFSFLWQRCLRRCLPFTCYFLGLFLTERGQRAATQAATATAARVSVRKIVSFSCSTFNLCIISAASFLMFCQQQNATKNKTKWKGKAQSLKIAKQHRCGCAAPVAAAVVDCDALVICLIKWNFSTREKNVLKCNRKTVNKSFALLQIKHSAQTHTHVHMCASVCVCRCTLVRAINRLLPCRLCLLLLRFMYCLCCCC